MVGYISVGTFTKIIFSNSFLSVNSFSKEIKEVKEIYKKDGVKIPYSDTEILRFLHARKMKPKNVMVIRKP